MLKNQLLITVLLMLFSVVSYGQIANEVQGAGSGASLTSADYVTFYGDSSGHNHTSGLNTTYIGYKAGYSQTVQADNTFIGAYSGEFSTSGTDNVFIGKYAGRYCNGTDNTVIGTEAGMAMTSGASDNTIIGEEAGQALIDGDDNVFIGEDAGYNTIGSNGGSSLQGSDNTFVGSTAGRSNTTGYGNAFFGDEAGYDNTTGKWNTAIGDSAGIDNGVGWQNTFVGHGAGCATEHGDQNTMIGAYAGGDNNRTNNTSNANRNTYLGNSTGFSNREGSDNVGIGAGADFGNTNRSRCIFIGGTGYATHGQWSGDGFHSVNANDATSIGYQAQTDGQYGIGIGHYMDQHGVQSVSMGYSTNTEAAADYSVLIGATGYLDKEYTVGLGYATSVSGVNSIAVGANSIVQNDGAIVMGYGATSTDPSALDPLNNIAIGYGANVQGNNAIAIGNAATAVTDNTMVLGGATYPLSVGIGTDAPNANASLDLADTNKGLLVNRVTNAERTTMITTPASGVALTTTDAGLMVYDTDDSLLYIWDGTQWGEVGSNAGSGVSAVPDLLNYQSLVRDNLGNILANQLVSFRINVIDVTSGSTTVFSETHDVTTSAQGLVNFEIGGGAIVSGLFTAIDWSHNNSLQIELDAAGGSTYVTMGTTSFVSVPYALRAKYAENLTSSTNAKMSNSSEDDRIEALENEVQELKKLMNQLLKKK
ncbi:MAG: hemagluttinin family protein [Flavobacteriaceae bacterium]|nr:hemagluttinin family protein [Flavobacteriaceae bacterium]